MPGAADDEPQAVSDVPMPIAAIVRSIAELPTARPIDVRKSRLAIPLFFVGISFPAVNRLADYKSVETICHSTGGRAAWIESATSRLDRAGHMKFPRACR